MRIGIIGGGAMGTLFAHALAARHDVTLLDAREEIVAAVAAHGVTMEGAPARKVTATRNPDALRASQAIFIFVKAHETLRALRPFAGRLDPSTLVVSLQNGLGNEEAIKTALGTHIPLVLGITDESCVSTGPGRSRHTGTGSTILGSGGASQSSVQAVEELLQKNGFSVSAAYDIRSHLWGKLIANAAINPTAALLDRENGIIIRNPNAGKLARSLAEEGAAAAKALRINLPFMEPWEYVRGIVEAAPDADNSMTIDLRLHRLTEIDQINGAIVATGRRTGVPTPYNDAVFTLVKAKEAIASSPTCTALARQGSFPTFRNSG